MAQYFRTRGSVHVRVKCARCGRTFAELQSQDGEPGQCWERWDGEGTLNTRLRWRCDPVRCGRVILVKPERLSALFAGAAARPPKRRVIVL